MNVVMEKHEIKISGNFPVLTKKYYGDVISKKVSDSKNLAKWILEVKTVEDSSWSHKNKRSKTENQSDEMPDDFDLDDECLLFKVGPGFNYENGCYLIYYKIDLFEGEQQPITITSVNRRKLEVIGFIRKSEWPYADDVIIKCSFEFYRTVCSKINSKFILDFEKLLHNDKHHDVTFKCSDKTIGAHKLILASRCQTFDKMFEEDQNKQVIEVPDVSSDVLADMLSFMYCHKIKNSKNYPDLYVLADKFQIEDLLEHCYRYILCNTKGDTLIGCLALFETYKKGEFKISALAYFTDLKNKELIKKLMEDKKWKDMAAQYPNLAEELTKAFEDNLKTSEKQNVYLDNMRRF